jgi:ElaB/YqjD/DUF883 family membrane-anchored ribosome-binding protein
METIDKAVNSAHVAFNRSANATNQAAETLGEKDVHLKHAEQQLLKNFRNYVRYNPWLT